MKDNEIRSVPISRNAHGVDLVQVLEDLRKHSGSEVIAITQDGVPVLAVMTWQSYEADEETLALLSQESMLAQLMASQQDIRLGKMHCHVDAQKELGSGPTGFCGC